MSLFHSALDILVYFDEESPVNLLVVTNRSDLENLRERKLSGKELSTYFTSLVLSVGTRFVCLLSMEKKGVCYSLGLPLGSRLCTRR